MAKLAAVAQFKPRRGNDLRDFLTAASRKNRISARARIATTHDVIERARRNDSTRWGNTPEKRKKMWSHLEKHEQLGQKIVEAPTLPAAIDLMDKDGTVFTEKNRYSRYRSKRAGHKLVLYALQDQLEKHIYNGCKKRDLKGSKSRKRFFPVDEESSSDNEREKKRARVSDDSE